MHRPPSEQADDPDGGVTYALRAAQQPELHPCHQEAESEGHQPRDDDSRQTYPVHQPDRDEEPQEDDGSNAQDTTLS